MIAFLVSALIGIAFVIILLWAEEEGRDAATNHIWSKVAKFRAWIARDDPNGKNLKTLVRFSLPALIFLIFLLSVRDDIVRFFRKRGKRTEKPLPPT